MEIQPKSDAPESDVSASEIIYPPKFVPAPNQSNIWLQSVISLFLYLALGYFIFPSFKILVLITFIILIHEFGHFLAMKFFGYKDLSMFFIPLLGAYVSGTKREVSQKESAVILLAGPLPGIIIGILLLQFSNYFHFTQLAGIPVYYVAFFFIFLNIVNLLPVYPLDGGQLLNRVFLNENENISRIFIIISVIAISWFAWKTNFPVLLIFPVLMIARLIGDNKINHLEKKVESTGINTAIDYEELADKDYWTLRNLVIEEMPQFKDVPAAPPYEYSYKEEKIMNVIQSLLHRMLIQDVSIAGKILILIIWLAAAATPWLFKMDLSFLRQFGH